MTAGLVDGLTITASEDGTCARCGGRGGDMVTFKHSPERCGCLAPVPQAVMRVHVACMESLLYLYRTGRKPRTQRKGE